MEWEKIFANDMSDKGFTFMSQYKKQATWFKNGHKMGIDIFPKKTYRWPTGTGEDAQCH